MRRSEIFEGAGEGRGINAHPNQKNKNLGGETFKKGFAVILTAVLLISAIPAVAMALDWQQFQKDEIAMGWTTDSAPVNEPELAWWKPTSGTGMGGIDVTPIVADGAVYVLDYKGYLWSFDANTGAENWHTKCNAADGTFELSVPAYHNGIVYVAASSGSEGAGAGRVNAIYANNGTIREYAYYGLSGFQLNTPVRYADDKIYIGNWKGGSEHTEDNGTYYCIDASDVTNKIWNRTASYVTGYYWAGAAIVGNYIIYGDDRANVTCLNKDTGAFVDYVNVSEPPFNINNPVEEIRSSIAWNESTGRIYFTGKKPSPVSGHAYTVGFNPNTGHFDTTDYWVTDIGYSTSTPAVYNGRVYVCIGGMYGGSGVRCLNEADGTIRYSIDKGAAQASPAVSIVDGHVYIYFTTNVNNGSAYCVEDTGSALVERWEWNPPYPDNQYILQGMAISDGMVYFGTDYGRIYALKEGQVQFEIPIYKNNNDPKNLFSIPLNSSNTTLAEVIGDDAVDYDTVYRYVNGEGYKSATYYGGTWWDADKVEPIEPEVGYEYRRSGDAFNITNVGQLLQSLNTTIYGESSTGDGKNLIGYASLDETNLSSTFNGHPVDYDTVYRYVNGVGYKSTTYYSGTWWDADKVEPIEPGAGYEYRRVDETFYWTYNP